MGEELFTELPVFFPAATSVFIILLSTSQTDVFQQTCSQTQVNAPYRVREFRGCYYRLS